MPGAICFIRITLLGCIELGNRAFDIPCHLLENRLILGKIEDIVLSDTHKLPGLALAERDQKVPSAWRDRDDDLHGSVDRFDGFQKFLLTVFEFVGHITHPRRAKTDRKSTRLNSSHITISYAVFCLKKKIRQRKP